jgi:hypothetical protein
VRRWQADQQLRTEGAVAQLGVALVQVIAAFHHVIRKLVADGKTEAARTECVIDQVEPDDLRFFAAVKGEIRTRQGLAGRDDAMAIAFVEPFRLNATLRPARAATGDAPLDHQLRIGLVELIAFHAAMHLVARGGAAQVVVPAPDAAVGRIGMIQRCQDAPLGQDGGIVFALVGIEQLGQAFQPGIARSASKPSSRMVPTSPNTWMLAPLTIPTRRSPCRSRY